MLKDVSSEITELLDFFAFSLRCEINDAPPQRQMEIRGIKGDADERQMKYFASTD